MNFRTTFYSEYKMIAAVVLTRLQISGAEIWRKKASCLVNSDLRESVGVGNKHQLAIADTTR